MSNVQVSQIVKAQVTQRPSHPKLKLPKVQVVQIAKSPRGPQVKKTYWAPMAKNIHGPVIAKNVSSPTMTKQRKLLHGQEYLWPSNSQKYDPHMAQNIYGPPMANKHFNVKI